MERHRNRSVPSEKITLSADQLLDRLNVLLGIDKVGSTATSIVHVADLSRDQIKSLLDNEEDLSKVAPRFLELLVAELLTDDGWSVHLVPNSNAKGPDIIAFGSRGSGEQIIVECKRWNRAVGVNVVRIVMYWVEIEYAPIWG